MNLNVLGLQFDIVWEDKAANFATVRRLLEQARPGPETLVVLPEMFATGFSMNVEKVAEDWNGPANVFLSEMARAHGVWMLGGVVVREGGQRARNNAVLVSPEGERKSVYSKMRPFTPGGEASVYQGGEGPVLFAWSGLRVAPLVCYDLRFPELFRSAVALGEPELFVVIACWPAHRRHHWTRLLQARAIENQACVLGVNRIGADPFFKHAGGSVFVDPQGEILQDAGAVEGFVRGRVELEELRRYREKLPFLKDFNPAQFPPGNGLSRGLRNG